MRGICSLLLLLLLYIPVILFVVSPRIVVIGNANIFLLVHVIIISAEWIAVLCHDGILLVIFADNDVRWGTSNDHRFRLLEYHTHASCGARSQGLDREVDDSPTYLNGLVKTRTQRSPLADEHECTELGYVVFEEKFAIFVFDHGVQSRH